MKTYKVVKVEWEDSSTHVGWRRHSETRELDPMKCTSCGLLVKTQKGSIGISTTVAENQDKIDTVVIPRKCVKSIEQIAKIRR